MGCWNNDFNGRRKGHSHTPLPDIVRRPAAAALFDFAGLAKGAQMPLHRRRAHGRAELGDLRLGEPADPRPDGVANGIERGEGDQGHTLLKVPVCRDSRARQVLDKGHRIVLSLVPSVLRRLQSIVIVFLRFGDLSPPAKYTAQSQPHFVESEAGYDLYPSWIMMPKERNGYKLLPFQAAGT